MSSGENTTQPLASQAPGLPAPSAIRGAIRQVPFRLCATVPLAGLKLGDIQTLRKGQVLATTIAAAHDVPVLVGGALFAYAELDNMDGQMAVRITSLS